MESIWLIITTFRPTVLAVVAFLLALIVGSLILWIVLELRARRRTIRRERRIHNRGLRELHGRKKRQAERDLFFDQVQRIMNDFNK